MVVKHTYHIGGFSFYIETETLILRQNYIKLYKLRHNVVLCTISLIPLFFKQQYAAITTHHIK